MEIQSMQMADLSASLILDVFDRHNKAINQKSLERFRCHQCNKTIPLQRKTKFAYNFKCNIMTPFCDGVCVAAHMKKELALLGFAQLKNPRKISFWAKKLHRHELIELYYRRFELEQSSSLPERALHICSY